MPPRQLAAQGAARPGDDLSEVPGEGAGASATPAPAGLADDLRALPNGEPILARPVGRAERLWRWCCRNPVFAGLSATVVLVLLAGTLVSGYFALEAGRRRQDAEDAAELADRQKRRADDKADEADKNARQANWRAYVSDMQRIGHEWEFGRVSRMRTLLDSHLPARAGGEDLRGMEWHFWDHLCRGEVCTFRGHDSGVAGVAFDPDGKRVVSVGVEIIEKHDPSLHIWEADTGKLIRSLPGETCVALSADGRWLAALSEKHDPPPEIALWDAITGRQTFTLKGHGASAIYALVFSPDNKLLASCGGDWTTRLWDVASGKEVRTLRGHTLRAALRRLPLRRRGVGQRQRRRHRPPLGRRLRPVQTGHFGRAVGRGLDGRLQSGRQVAGRRRRRAHFSRSGRPPPAANGSR